ncbi:hypothetical protein DSUL_50172 [Desulfovibrionales bacterium]
MWACIFLYDFICVEQKDILDVMWLAKRCRSYASVFVVIFF